MDLDVENINSKVARYKNKLMKKLMTSRLKKNAKRYRAAIEGIFARYGHGIVISMPALISLVMSDLGATASNYQEMNSQLRDFINLPSSGRWIEVSKGRDGGCRLVNGSVPVGRLGATCKSRIVQPTHSPKKKAKKR